MSRAPEWRLPAAPSSTVKIVVGVDPATTYTRLVTEGDAVARSTGLLAALETGRARLTGVPA